MRTLALMVAYMVTAALLYVIPAIIISIIFPCTYTEVVTFPFYVAFIGIMALVGAAPVTEEISEKI